MNTSSRREFMGAAVGGLALQQLESYRWRCYVRQRAPLKR